MSHPNLHQRLDELPGKGAAVRFVGEQRLEAAVAGSVSAAEEELCKIERPMD